MLAVIKTGGKQYLVRQGDVLTIEKITKKTKKNIVFDEILLLVDETKGTAQIGRPFLKNVKVKAELLEEGKGKKVRGAKYKPKVRYYKNLGHRQPYSKVKITDIAESK